MNEYIRRAKEIVSRMLDTGQWELATEENFDGFKIRDRNGNVMCCLDLALKGLVPDCLLEEPLSKPSWAGDLDPEITITVQGNGKSSGKTFVQFLLVKFFRKLGARVTFSDPEYDALKDGAFFESQLEMTLAERESGFSVPRVFVKVSNKEIQQVGK